MPVDEPSLSAKKSEFFQAAYQNYRVLRGGGEGYPYYCVQPIELEIMNIENLPPPPTSALVKALQNIQIQKITLGVSQK